MAKKAEKEQTFEKINPHHQVSIENVSPQVDHGRFPAKRVVGEKVTVQADIFVGGHDEVSARLLYRKADEKDWHIVPMTFLSNDIWQGEFTIEEQLSYCFTVQGWVDHFQTWQKDLRKRFEAHQDLKVELLIGIKILEELIRDHKGDGPGKIRKFVKAIQDAKDISKAASLALERELLDFARSIPDEKSLVTYGKTLEIIVDRPKALFSTWYEFFPRSFGTDGRHGTFKDTEKILPEIARMGFDVVYLPPIHPIGKTHRKGKNNSPSCLPQDPGSPWAIGSKEGGHKAIHSQLGTMKDFLHFVDRAKSFNLEVAMDLAFQCSADHPYVKEHPEWFKRRPDGTIQFAENPPKKYEDIYPLNFDTQDWESLWQELKSIVVFWLEKGVRIFRVDNPHTKPFAFWSWLIKEITKDYPDVIFLSEAFTRPKVMQQLAKLGFHQSYTYFTWRTSKWDFTQYMNELTKTEIADYFRPNFWTNTPDILAYHFQYAGRPMFVVRFLLAATLSSNYGLYGPAFELCVNEPVGGKEEYLYSEKYELKKWNWDQEGNLKDLIAHINQIRKENPALQQTCNIQFCEIPNGALLCYLKSDDKKENLLLIAINLDCYCTQSGWVRIPLSEYGLDASKSYKVVDLITKDKYIWHGEWNYIQLNPFIMPAHIFRIGRIQKNNRRTLTCLIEIQNSAMIPNGIKMPLFTRRMSNAFMTATGTVSETSKV
ncbi:MAG: alpha-1,4-glucan--maltose-1-phosphate maltosyltransferase [Candidatus Omnitrophota bacterium]